MTLLFLLLLGGSFYEFFMTIALAIPPLTLKNRGGGALIRDRALNRANTVVYDCLLIVINELCIQLCGQNECA